MDGRMWEHWRDHMWEHGWDHMGVLEEAHKGNGGP